MSEISLVLSNGYVLTGEPVELTVMLADACRRLEAAVRGPSPADASAPPRLHVIQGGAQ